MKPIDWIAAKKAHGGGSCDGLTNGETFVDDNNPDTELECSETGIPMAHWCSQCIGWAAVCELAFQQREKP